MRKHGLFQQHSDADPASPRGRIQVSGDDVTLYAVGDVHGCLDELLALEQRIVSDAEKIPGDKLIVMLGDYVDRGPASAGVIEHLMGQPPEGFERICLTGNHEVAFLDCIDGRIPVDQWLGLGSSSTLTSYNIPLARVITGDGLTAMDVRNAVPDAHIEFLRSLPILVESERFVCVHAGLKAGLPIAEHSDHDLVWTRPSGASTDYPKWVIHGHTPVDAVRREGRRVNIDTGAFQSGRISALRIWHNKARILSNLD